MNAHVDLSTLEGQKAHYAAIRARLAGVRTPPQTPPRADRYRAPVLSASEAQWIYDTYLSSMARAVDKMLPPKPRPFTYTCPMLRAIMGEVAEKHGITVVDIQSHRRDEKAVVARREYFYRARTETPRSLPMIARQCGGRDHTTAISAIRKYERLMKEPTP